MAVKKPEPEGSLGAPFEPAETAPTPYESWRRLATESLRGGSLDELVSSSVEGLATAPLYTREQAVQAPWGTLPSPLWALRRGGGRLSQPGEEAVQPWPIRQRYRDPDLEAARDSMLQDLAGGVTSVELCLDGAARQGLDPLTEPGAEALARDGVAIHDRWDLQAAVEGVRLDLAPVSFDAGAAFRPAAALLFAQLRTARVDPPVGSHLGADPVAALARFGRLPQGVDRALEELAEVAGHCAAKAPGVRAVRVDSSPWSDAGAGEALETGMVLATGLTYLRAMVAAGVGIETAARQIVFRIALDSDLFAGVAKLRALRFLWGRMLLECGVDPGLAVTTPVEVATAQRVLTRVDPWGNLLRITASTFSGVLGGADCVVAESFDSSLGLPSELGRRLARNTQHVLAEESSLHRVVDPAGGSWYVEHLTRDLAQAAWRDLQGIERLGGAVEALRDGALGERMAATAEVRAQRVADGSEPLIGVSEFVAAQDDALPEAPVRDRAALAEAARTRLLERRVARGGTPQHAGAFTDAIEAAAAGATVFELMAPRSQDPLPVVPLRLRRLAEPYEGSDSVGRGERP